jgi:hypothetical protein
MKHLGISDAGAQNRGQQRVNFPEVSEQGRRRSMPHVIWPDVILAGLVTKEALAQVNALFAYTRQVARGIDECDQSNVLCSESDLGIPAAIHKMEAGWVHFVDIAGLFLRAGSRWLSPSYL